MKTQKKGNENISRIPVSLSPLELTSSFCFYSVVDSSQSTLFSNTGHITLLRTLRINQK
tara:strand:- start:17250 stop:17426 length:177 start_codon:yes stop_codon:yes gene_type:complete